VETHHRHKKDSPSGTAITLQRAISPDDPNQIQTHSIRAGEVIGEHTIGFYGRADKITLSHSAQDRSLFARGAIEVALWLAQKNRQDSPQSILKMDHYLLSFTHSAPLNPPLIPPKGDPT
jgi:dihydrodipicolinate reductase